MGILDEDVQRVRESTDLVALIGEHVALKRVGRRFQGLCPFHTEKTPSFSVNPELGAYFCFGCQKSGDAITFVREVEQLDFVGAVERLAARANITLRYDDANFSAERKRKQRLHEATQAAIDFYHERLLSGPDGGEARRYLRSRGFEGDAARRFMLGWAPDAYDALSTHLQQQKFSRQDLADAGLAFVNKANKLQDSFRARLMFPIWDARGEPVGFGGRLLEGGQGPKYKNTAETRIYQKSRLLYGLNFAKGEIVARGEVVICEGYTDVMAFALAGVPVAVATCGTALADDHFITLKNLARKVTLAYDADNAGMAAADRCYQWEQRFEVEFQVADLPAGRDPADVFRDDPQRLEAAVKGATPFLEFRIERLLRSEDLSSLEARARIAQRRGGDDRRAPERARARPVRHEAVRPARHRCRPAARGGDARQVAAAGRKGPSCPGPRRGVRGRSTRARRHPLRRARARADERASRPGPVLRPDRAERLRGRDELAMARGAGTSIARGRGAVAATRSRRSGGRQPLERSRDAGRREPRRSIKSATPHVDVEA